MPQILQQRIEDIYKSFLKIYLIKKRFASLKELSSNHLEKSPGHLEMTFEYIPHQRCFKSSRKYASNPFERDEDIHSNPEGNVLQLL